MKLMSTVLKEMYKPEETLDEFYDEKNRKPPYLPHYQIHAIYKNHSKDDELVEEGDEKNKNADYYHNRASQISKHPEVNHVYLFKFNKGLLNGVYRKGDKINIHSIMYQKTFQNGVHISTWNGNLGEETLDELYNDRSGGGHRHPFFHRITAIDGNFNETKITEGHGDPEHWLRAAHQLSLRNPNHIVKIAHHQLVHFRNGGSGYEFRRSRYFHQGRETSLTNLHELYDDRKSGGGNHWGAPYLYSVHSDSKQFHEGYGDTDAFESYHEKAKKVSSNNLGKPIHLHIYQIHYDENQKRYTGYRLVKHKLYMNGVHLHDLNEEIQLDEFYIEKNKKYGGNGGNGPDLYHVGIWRSHPHMKGVECIAWDLPKHKAEEIARNYNNHPEKEKNTVAHPILKNNEKEIQWHPMLAPPRIYKK